MPELRDGHCTCAPSPDGTFPCGCGVHLLHSCADRGLHYRGQHWRIACLLDRLAELEEREIARVQHIQGVQSFKGQATS